MSSTISQESGPPWSASKRNATVTRTWSQDQFGLPPRWLRGWTKWRCRPGGPARISYAALFTNLRGAGGNAHDGSRRAYGSREPASLSKRAGTYVLAYPEWGIPRHAALGGRPAEKVWRTAERLRPHHGQSRQVLRA